ncbi:hypothetical protein ABK040_007898 [Willaertia magna]
MEEQEEIGEIEQEMEVTEENEEMVEDDVIDEEDDIVDEEEDDVEEDEEELTEEEEYHHFTTGENEGDWIEIEENFEDNNQVSDSSDSDEETGISDIQRLLRTLSQNTSGSRTLSLMAPLLGSTNPPFGSELSDQDIPSHLINLIRSGEARIARSERFTNVFSPNISSSTLVEYEPVASTSLTPQNQRRRYVDPLLRPFGGRPTRISETTSVPSDLEQMLTELLREEGPTTTPKKPSRKLGFGLFEMEDSLEEEEERERSPIEQLNLTTPVTPPVTESSSNINTPTEESITSTTTPTNEINNEQQSGTNSNNNEENRMEVQEINLSAITPITPIQNNNTATETTPLIPSSTEIQEQQQVITSTVTPTSTPITENVNLETTPTTTTPQTTATTTSSSTENESQRTPVTQNVQEQFMTQLEQFMLQVQDSTMTGESITSEQRNELLQTPTNQEQNLLLNQQPPNIEQTNTSTQFAIDPQFLAALPDDLRQEVLAAHIAELVDTTSTSEQSTISPEFLNALPLEIRNEVLEQERLLREQAQRRREEEVQRQQNVSSSSSETTTNNTTTTTIPPPTLLQPPVLGTSSTTIPQNNGEFDAASFIASLSPDLREEILLTTDDAVLATLPPEMAAEAYALRNRFYQRQRRQQRRQHIIENSRSNIISKAIKNLLTHEKEEEKTEALLKDNDIIAILRLIYISGTVSKTPIQNILFQLCNHKESRKTVVSLLLDIIFNHSTPIEEIPSKLKPIILHHLFGVPSHAGFSLIEEKKQIPTTAMIRFMETIIHLTKNTRVLGIITETEEILEEDKTQEEKLDQPPSNTLSKLFSLLSDPYFSTDALLLEYNLQLLDHCVEYVNKMIKTLGEEMTKYQKDVEEEEKVIKEFTETNKEISTEEQEKIKKMKEELSKITKKRDLLLNSALKVLTNEAIGQLVKVLVRRDCSEKAVKYSVCVMNNMSSSLPSIRSSILKELSTAAKEEAKKVMEVLNKSTRKVEKSPFKSTLSGDTDAIEKLKFCRILKSYSSVLKKFKKEKSKETDSTVGSSDIMDLSEDNNLLTEHSLDYVWEALDKYLSNIPVEEEEENKETKALNALKKKKKSSSLYSALIPFVEAFFSFHAGFIEEKEKNSKDALVSEMIEGIHTPTSAKSIGDKSRVESFLEKHRVFLNTLVRSNPALLHTTLSLFMKYPKYVDFDNKRTWFRSRLADEQKKNGLGGALRLNVRRDHIFVDSFFQFRQKTAEECKEKISVRFQGEEGIDAGGLTKEWFLCLSKEMLNPNYALFIPCADQRTYQPNPSSYINSEHLSYFQFIGRVISMAIYNEQYLDCYFTRSFYKHILGIPITYHDIESIDPNYYKNLNWMLKNDIEDVLDYNFTQEIDNFGERKNIELKPNGKNIAVTNENKAEYVKLVTELKMTKSIEKQLNSFLKAFYEIIPKKLIQVFNEQELELLISGLPDLDIQDIKNNTEYKGYTSDSPQIKWFWNIVESFDRNEKALLLQFATGTSKIPLGGFAQLLGMNGIQKFNIHRISGNYERLPSSHTCFNQLDLPEYESEEIMRERLLLAIREGSEGFGFV